MNKDAFPRASSPQTTGLSVRAYFAAHAPAEPQPWFKPEVPPRPGVPDKFVELTAEERRDLSHIDNGGELAEVSPNVRKFIRRLEVARKALESWEAFYKMARYVQWPVAWADAMIAEMERSKP